MKKSFYQEFRRFSIGFILVACISFFVDAFWYGCFFYLLAYCIWHLSQIYRVASWFNNRSNLSPPESLGFWGDLMDEIYRQFQSQARLANQLRADIAYLKDSFASLSDAVVMVNDSGCIDWINLRSTPLLGLDLDKDQGQMLVNLLRSPAFIHFFESNDYSQPIKIQSPVNPDVTLKVQITRFGQGNRLVFARDISHIEELEVMRQDFVSNVSHELRTPLTVITGYIDNFAFFVDKNPTMEKPLNQMADQAKRMEALIQDLLDLSRLETRSHDKKPLIRSMAKLAEMVVDEAKASLLAQKKHRTISLEIKSDLSILCYPEEIHSAMLNLVVNACKYTNEDGVVEVTLGENTQGGYFSVKDNGVGIDHVEIPRLTERFYRVDKSRFLNSGGTGLGLAIVKRILIRHDAKLLISSQLNQGSMFTCLFPFHRIIQSSVEPSKMTK